MYGETYAFVHVQLGSLSYGFLGRPEVDLLLQLWQGLISTFVLPGTSQEIGLLPYERSGLLIYRDSTIPPHPSILQPVVRRLYDMIETIFPTFLFCNWD
jgi:hypothetical protein